MADQEICQDQIRIELSRDVVSTPRQHLQPTIPTSKPANHDQKMSILTPTRKAPNPPLSNTISTLASFSLFTCSQTLLKSFRKMYAAFSACAFAPTACSFWRSSYFRSTRRERSCGAVSGGIRGGRRAYGGVSPQGCLHHFPIPHVSEIQRTLRGGYIQKDDLQYRTFRIPIT